MKKLRKEFLENLENNLYDGHELLESEEVLISAIMSYLIYERQKDSYRGWWGGVVKKRLERILKECILNGDESDDYEVYKELVRKKK